MNLLDKQTVYDVLEAAKASGAELAELFAERKSTEGMTMINGKVEKVLSGIDSGVGIRIINGGKVVYVYTNKTDRDELIKIARSASLTISGNRDNTVQTLSAMTIPNLCPAEIRISDIKKSEIANILRRGSQSAFNYDPLITQTAMGYASSEQKVLIANSEGLWAEDERVRTRASVSAVASSESEKQTGYFGPGAMKGFEFMRALDIEAIASDAARCAVTMLKADECPSGRFPVIIDNGFGGVIFHEACGHGLEAASVSKNASVFAGKLGQKIASEKVTAIDDGTIANSWGSISVDDEGHLPQKNILIENGILKGYMTDRFNGARMGAEATGSSRRESYKYVPVSRMTNTYIAAGNDSRDDIISSTKYGIYARHMGGGSVDPVSGDFNFAVNEAYIVRNGKICEPVRGATLIGKGSEVLLNIDMVSSDLKLAEGMCGASSGSIPVCVGQPMIRVSEMTVGGRG